MSGQGPPLVFFGVFFVFWCVMMLIALASMVFWIIAIIDVARRQFKDDNTKLLWVIVVVVGHFIGGIVYYIVGRPTGWMPGERPLS